MKTLMLTGLALGTALLALSPAEAAQGCGAGYHRGPAGHCRPNAVGHTVVTKRTVVTTPGGRLVIGNYYKGQGYWDGHRYWQHRYRHNNDWRYRG